MNLKKLIDRGEDILDIGHAEGETAKLGNMRGGSAGILTEKGDVYGKCMRVHYLRMKGHQLPIERNIKTMFAAGLANEHSLEQILNALEEDGYSTKYEDEIPVVANFGDVLATGRPDAVTFKDGAIAFGIEMKNVSSIHTARNVIADFKPGAPHLVQAAFYSMKLGEQYNDGVPIPYKLIYTSGVYWHINFNKYLTTAFQDRVNICEHDGDRPFRVKPGRYVYDLVWIDGVLYYGTEDSPVDQLVETNITLGSIDNYFGTLAALAGGDKPPKAPIGKHVNGGKSYKECQYCSFKDVCADDPVSMDQFTDGAILTINNLTKEMNNGG